MAGTDAPVTNQRVELVDIGLRAQRRVLNDDDWLILPMATPARDSAALYANNRKVAGDAELETLAMPVADWGNV